MNLILFLIVIGVSLITVRIGAIAFEITGLPWPLAKFQALSCFTGTGFTTRESELVTANPQRRKIASVLIILGHAGFVTLVATFANSLRSDWSTEYKIPFINSIIPYHMVPWVNLLIIILGVFVIYRVVINSSLAAKITALIKAHIIKRQIIEPVSFEELSVATGGYGVSRVEVCKNSPVLNKNLEEADLAGDNILVLAVEREGKVTPNPSPDTRFVLGDRVVCFGKFEDIRKKVYPGRTGGC
ncbi:MAG: TrkA C-terminal domain-containing protein [Candidatus Omnitrophica bacterium]|nr:TrkA C-terminal domain-containing protein [Candidatus Omnitrophota bacterium]